MISRVVASVVFGGLVAMTSLGSAQSRPASTSADARDGRAAFEQAYVAFQSLDYATALPLFQRAYQLTRNPAMLYNIGATLEALGRSAEAATAFRRYVAAVPDAPNRGDVESRAARLERAASAAPQRPAPASTTPALASSAPPHAVESVTPARPVWPFVVLGLGVAIGVSGGVTLALTPDPGATMRANETDYLRAADAATTQEWVGGVLVGVGAAATIAGIIGLALRPASRRLAALRWNISPLHEGALMQFGWRGPGL
jgi:tetratricopeptide (TPR) repeat protein